MNPHLFLKVQLSFSRNVHRAADQTASDEEVVNGDDEQRDDVEDEEGGGGVDFWVQLAGVGVRRTGHKCLIGIAGGEGVQVGEDGLGDRQSYGQQPDEPDA